MSVQLNRENEWLQLMSGSKNLKIPNISTRIIIENLRIISKMSSLMDFEVNKDTYAIIRRVRQQKRTWKGHGFLSNTLGLEQKK